MVLPRRGYRAICNLWPDRCFLSRDELLHRRVLWCLTGWAGLRASERSNVRLMSIGCQI